MALKPRGRHLLAGAALALSLYYAVWGGEYSAFDLLRLKRDRREAAERLRASEERMRGLAALSADWYWEQDAALRYT